MGVLSLQWHDHSSVFLGLVSSLLEKHRFSDATIACNGQLYPVHKFVLSVCSNYFNTIFEDTNAAQNHLVLILNDISQEILEALLKFMYLGHVSIEHEKFADLVSAAKSLQVKGLDIQVTLKESEDGGENGKPIAQNRSEDLTTITGHGSLTTVNDSKQSSSSSQNQSGDSTSKENTPLMVVPEVISTSEGSQHDKTHLRRGGDKARRGRPLRRAGSKRLHSQTDSSSGFPPVKRSNPDLPSQSSSSTIPAVAPSSQLSAPAGLMLSDASAAHVKQEMLTSPAQPQLEETPLPVIVEVVDDPSFQAIQTRPRPHRQYPVVHHEPVASSSSSSLRSFRKTDQIPKAPRPKGSNIQLANFKTVPDECLGADQHSDRMTLSNTSSRNKLAEIRDVAETRLYQTPSQRHQSWEPEPSSSSQLPIITSCYSMQPQASELSPSTSLVPEPLPPSQSTNLVDPDSLLTATPSKPDLLESSTLMLRTSQIAQNGMEFSDGEAAPVTQSEVNSSQYFTSCDRNSLLEGEKMEMAWENIRPGHAFPVKPCSVKLSRLSSNKTDSVNEVCNDHIAKEHQMYECLKCNFYTNYQDDFLKHIIESCSESELDCSDISTKSVVSSGDDQSVVFCHNSIGDTSVTRSTESNVCSKKLYKCKLCGALFQQMSCVLDHQKVHSASKYHKCPSCDYLACSSSLLKHHSANRKPGVVHKCTYCNFTACCAGLIKSHMNNALEGNKGAYETFEEEKNFVVGALDVAAKKSTANFKKPNNNSKNKKLKLPLHSPKKYRKYICHTCKTTFPSNTSLTKHEFLTGHGADKPLMCHFCDFRSTSSSALMSHMRHHSCHAAYTCSLCNYSCDIKRNIKRHLAVHHKIVKSCVNALSTPAALDPQQKSPNNEKSDEYGLSFNVEEFQKECSNKLLADREAQLEWMRPPQGEILSLSNTVKQRKKMVSDKSSTSAGKYVEDQWNSLPEVTRFSEYFLLKSKKKKDYKSNPSGFISSESDRKSKTLTSSLSQLEQENGELNRPPATYGPEKELPDGTLCGKYNENEALNRTLVQDGLVDMLPESSLSDQYHADDVIYRPLSLYGEEEELLDRPLTEKDEKLVQEK